MIRKGLRDADRGALAEDMRILLITETLAAGGAETFVVRLANALVAAHDVTIAVLIGQFSNPALEAQVNQSVHLEQLRLPALRTLNKLDGLARRVGVDFSLIRWIQRRWLRNLIRKTKPDVAHSHLFKADRLVTETREVRSAMRHVTTLHGDYAPFLSNLADPQMLKLSERMQTTLGRVDSIVSICAEQEEFVRDRFPDVQRKLVRIYNGFEPWRPIVEPSSRPDRPLRFGMASRGVKLKGWSKAIAAFSKLKRGAAELILVGEGKYLAELRAQPVLSGVRFVGFSDNPVDWLIDCDVCLLPSEFPNESLPTAVMEYLFCAKPVIATDVGEIATMIRTPTGKLAGTLLSFEEGRVSVDDLAAAMQSYVDDPALRRRHAALAPAAFAKFDMGACAAAYARLYAEALKPDAINSSTNASH